MTWPNDQSVVNNKLLVHKSSFQAWKCVSFGCSLLAAVLLLSKCYEVSTDLNLLLGIERLLSVQEASFFHADGTDVSNDTTRMEGSPMPLSWPPVPIEVMLPAQNNSGFGMESMRDNSTMLMSHMHLSLGRELASEHLLRQEVDAFVAEFKMAKSTLSLSVMLVSVYIVSWILMTLAINDTRISNDISLRNILLLSVFGAIDVAASVGFVMVRLIMIVASSGLKDTPTRLSADQLTAFTALRLIGMRSCSAYVDIYVSVVMALLTILRLYAITRALSYYRRLRRLNDSSELDIDQQVAAGLKQQQQRQEIWSTNYCNALPSGLFATAQQMISPTLAGRQMLPQSNLQSDHHQAAFDRSFRLVPDQYDQQQIPSRQQAAPYYNHGTLPINNYHKGSHRYTTSSMPPTSKLVFDDDNKLLIANRRQQSRRASALPRTNQNELLTQTPQQHQQNQHARMRTATSKTQPEQTSEPDASSLLLVNEQVLLNCLPPDDVKRRRLLDSARLSDTNGIKYASDKGRLFNAASLSKLNSVDAGRVGYTLLRARQLQRQPGFDEETAKSATTGRYRLVQVARFKSPRPSRPHSQNKAAASYSSGAASMSSSAESSASSTHEDADEARHKTGRRRYAKGLITSPAAGVEFSQEDLLLQHQRREQHLVQQHQQQQLSMSPKQVVEVSAVSKEPQADSFLLSKYYYT